jgi:uncharacterized protein YecT (DUF1311 family)
MQPSLIAGCKDQLTQQRTAELNAYLHGKTLPVSGSSYQAADRKLNQLYQQLQKTLPPQRKSKLEAAELAWINFRDSSCRFEASSGGSTGLNQCLIRVTEQRNQQLTKHLQTNAALSNHGLFARDQLSHGSRLRLVSSLKMILKILSWSR